MIQNKTALILKSSDGTKSIQLSHRNHKHGIVYCAATVTGTICYPDNSVFSLLTHDQTALTCINTFPLFEFLAPMIYTKSYFI